MQRMLVGSWGLLLAGATTIATSAYAQDTTPPAQNASADQTESPSLKTVKTDSGEILVTAKRYVPAGVVTASKGNIPLIEMPQSISVISRDQIDLLNFIDAQQAVRYTAGAFGENYGPDPRYDFVTVRGFTPKQYIDGLAVPNTVTIQSTGVDLYAFQSLDILKGPSSTLYGSAPPGGILNEESRRASSTFGGELEAKYGTNSFGEIAGTVTGPATDYLDVRFTGLYRSTSTDVDHTNDKRILVAPTATFKIDSRTRLTALLYYQYDDDKGGVGGFLPEDGTLVASPYGKIKRSTNLDDPADEYIRRQFGAGYEFDHDFGGGVRFVSNTRWSRYKERTPIGLYPTGFANDDERTLTRANYTYAEDVNSFATDNRLSANLGTGPITQKLLAGVDYRNVTNKAGYGYASAGTIDAYDPVYDPSVEQAIGYPNAYASLRLKQTGVYGQDQINVGALHVMLGGRYDWSNLDDRLDVFTQKAHKFTWRAGASYVLPSGIAPYVSYSTSFEPVLGEGADGKPFKPSSVSQWEGGIKYDARGLPSDIKLFATAAAFDMREKNFVSPTVANTPQIGYGTQSGEAEVYGAELELVARIHDQLSINASYSYTHSEVTKSVDNPEDIGQPLPTTPKNKVSLFVDYTLSKGPLAGFGGGFGGRYTSGSAGALPSQTVYYPGGVIWGQSSTLFDAILHYDLPGWRVAMNASNLFDKKYVARCAASIQCFYGAGRQVIGTITKKF